jgi:catechol 2,3-dioxygenase-like lactoylglutathione lyase family enzyme
MVITGLMHIAIKTNDLDATVEFYTKVLGLKLAARPAFDFPGAWIAVPTPIGEAIIHIYAGGPALGADGRTPWGTGAIDHISITAVGWDDCLARLKAHGLEWREAVVPGTSLWQIFVHDPSGVMLEITFNGEAEDRPTPDISNERCYRAGIPFAHSPAH